MLAGACLVTPQTARAELPKRRAAVGAKERLLKAPDRMPHCAAGLAVAGSPGVLLRLRMEVSAAAQTAVPLPGQASPVAARAGCCSMHQRPRWPQREGGHLYLVVPAGKSSGVILEGRAGAVRRCSLRAAAPAPGRSARRRLKAGRPDGGR